MNASVEIDGRTATGCARTPAESGVAATDWSSRLYDSLPALRACLARSQMDGASVTHVAAAPGGELELELRDADGARFHCNVPRGSARITSFEPAPADSAPGAVSPAFSRSIAAFARLGCDDAPIEVLSGNGEVLGYWQAGHCAESTLDQPP